MMKIQHLKNFCYEKIINRFEHNPTFDKPKPMPSKYIKQGNKLDRMA